MRSSKFEMERLATNNMNKNITEFKKGYHSRTSFMKNENGDLPMSWDSSVGVITDYRLNDQMIGV
jgi:hypothetical protein